MFALPGYDAFLGFLLIAAAVPVLALVTNKLLAPKSRAAIINVKIKKVFIVTC